MGRTAGRSSADTRQIILRGAAEAVLDLGIGVTLEQIAERAGVSKGGLLYHFTDKETLLLALVTGQLEDFRAEVLADVDPDDGPGRVVRAYVRVGLRPFLDGAGLSRNDVDLAARLYSIPAALGASEADAHRWREDLAADGLTDSTITLIVAAVDGAALASLWGAAPDPVRTVELERRLLALVEEDVAAGASR